MLFALCFVAVTALLLYVNGLKALVSDVEAMQDSAIDDRTKFQHYVADAFCNYGVGFALQPDHPLCTGS